MVASEVFVCYRTHRFEIVIVLWPFFFFFIVNNATVQFGPITFEVPSRSQNCLDGGVDHLMF